MKQKSQTRQTGAAKAIKDIRQVTRRQYSADEKNRIGDVRISVTSASPTSD